MTSQPGKLQKIASERGMSVRELIEWAILQSGSVIGAAMELRVNPNAIRHHMKMYKIRIEYTHSIRLVEDK